MTSKTLIKTILTLIFAATAISAAAQAERRYIRQGNQLYHSAIGDTGQVDTTQMRAAAELYRKAIEKSPASTEAKFNLANSEFRTRDFEACEREYKALANGIAPDTTMAKIYHNLGNSQLMQGKLRESIESYKNALRRNPRDIETKYNLALAQSKLQQQQNQQQQQQQDQDQQQNQDKNNEQQQQQQQDQQQQQQDNQQEQQQQQAQEQQAQEQQGQEGEPKEGEKISKEDAARILEALQNNEQKLQERLKNEQKQKSQSRQKSRDW